MYTDALAYVLLNDFKLRAVIHVLGANSDRIHLTKCIITSAYVFIKYIYMCAGC